MSLFLLVLFPLSFLLAILAFFTGETMASILTLGSYACFALFLPLSLHDINLRMMAQDISGIQDIYPAIESICIPAFLALNVVAGFRVFKTAKKSVLVLMPVSLYNDVRSKEILAFLI